MSPIDNRFLKNPGLLGTFSTRETMVFPFEPLPSAHRRRADIALVTWVAGEKAYEWFSVTGPAMRRYATRVGADLVVLDGFGGQPYALANKFRVQQVLTQYGYDAVLYVDADALIQDHCVNFFDLVPAGQVGILDEAPLYDEWMLAQYRREALALAASQGIPLDPGAIPAPRNSGLYLLPAAYAAVLDPPEHSFPLCGRNGATVEQTWMSLRLHYQDVPIFEFEPVHHWLWYADQAEDRAPGAMVLHFAGLGGSPQARTRRLLDHGSRSGAGTGRQRDGRDFLPEGHFDRQLTLHAPAPPALKIGTLRTIGTHRYGWSVATKALSVLADPAGVLFDDFVESTFLWHGNASFTAGNVPYREHWTGFIHNPPSSPDWPSVEGEKVTNLPRSAFWREGLPHCLGLFAMTDYLARWVTKEWDVPCEVVRYPTIRPDRVFDFDAFARSDKTVASIGFWLRRFSSFELLRAPGFRKLRPLPVSRDSVEGMQRMAEYELEERGFAKYHGEITQPALICDRLDGDAYDELLATSVVFLDLIDASAVTTVVECLVRATPLLINRIPPVVEYLGEDYPFYFDSLEEAERKILDLDVIRAAHEHMRRNPIIEELKPQTFLDRIVLTDTFQRVLESSASRRRYGH